MDGPLGPLDHRPAGPLAGSPGHAWIVLVTGPMVNNDRGQDQHDWTDKKHEHRNSKNGQVTVEVHWSAFQLVIGHDGPLVTMDR